MITNKKILKLCRMCGDKFYRLAGTRTLYCSESCANRYRNKQKAYQTYLKNEALLIAQGAPRSDCELFNADIKKAAQKHGILLPEVQV